MADLNACFISYSHSPEPGVQAIYEAFRDALATQVGLYLTKVPVYLDIKRLKGGVLYDQELPCQLCRSGCMVLLFSPSYFDIENTYCAREYKAMVQLEKMRLALTDAQVKNEGLIIPVVLRGEEALPDEVKKRQYYNLDRMLLQPADFGSKACAEIIKEIAAVIFSRFRAFKRAPAPVPCDSFTLPTDDEIRLWLQEVVDDAPPLKLPHT
jgi:hypothetical protein